VMDLSMPVMNGIDATRALKTLMPMVPVIVFSEYSDVFSEKEARSAGISAMVSKSEHVSVLIDKAHALLFPAAAWFSVGKSKSVPLEHAECSQSIFDGLPFSMSVWVVRNGLKAIEDSGFRCRNPLEERLRIKL
jgi:DNA-binding response OmpR family regulator